MILEVTQQEYARKGKRTAPSQRFPKQDGAIRL